MNWPICQPSAETITTLSTEIILCQGSCDSLQVQVLINAMDENGPSTSIQDAPHGET